MWNNVGVYDVNPSLGAIDKDQRFRDYEALTCNECFAVLELLAEAARMGIDLDRLEQLARQHMAKCPECQDQFKKRLDN